VHLSQASVLPVEHFFVLNKTDQNINKGVSWQGSKIQNFGFISSVVKVILAPQEIQNMTFRA